MQKGHVVDRQLHLFVVALVGLGDQFVDPAVRDLRQDAVSLADREENRVEHFVDALDHFALNTIELNYPASLRQASFFGCIQETHDLLQNLH